MHVPSMLHNSIYRTFLELGLPDMEVVDLRLLRGLARVQGGLGLHNILDIRLEYVHLLQLLLSHFETNMESDK